MTIKSGYKIMVVEDEAVIALRLQQRLTEMGYDVPGIAYSGEEAVEKAGSLRPDLILMDIMIPGKLDGIDAAEILGAELDVPVVFLTAYSEDNIVERAKKAEPYGYILKPFQDHEIKAAIEVALYKKEMEKAHHESEERYRALAENSKVGFWQTTLDGYTIYINPAMRRMLEIEDSEELRGKTYHSFYDAENLEIIKRELVKREKGMSSNYEVELTGRKGTKRNVIISGAPIFLSGDNIHSVNATFTDITAKKRVEKALMKAHRELEHRVKERTGDLEIKTKSLEEINTAMKVLLKKRQEDKKDLEDNVFANIKGLIMPYIRKIKKTNLDDRQKVFVNIIESNLNDVVSSFTIKMSKRYYNLTPQEIRIANLITRFDSSKEIAELLNLSPRTVETHRKNIRRKIGLKGKKANLRSHLLFID
ncbi:MAG: response regulator [Deltaproteobacteria bacterium]|nr:response regulator [Deltaproteobacteria bacterium]